MTNTDQYVELYHDLETETYEVYVHGNDDWDHLMDLTEREAFEEAECIASELGVEVVRT
jgi:hypothetical protein